MIAILTLEGSSNMRGDEKLDARRGNEQRPRSSLARTSRVMHLVKAFERLNYFDSEGASRGE